MRGVWRLVMSGSGGGGAFKAAEKNIQSPFKAGSKVNND